MSRLEDLRRCYALLDRLSERLGGPRRLAEFGGCRDWPERGVYFFFEPGEQRTESGNGLRVVRVGTHALKAGSRSTLRQRLGQHRGLASGGGNHRSSIFRLLIGQAALARGVVGSCDSWGVKGDLRNAALTLGRNRETLALAEAPVERWVTSYIGKLPFLWLRVHDDAKPESLRGVVERNAIALLSNHGRPSFDPASAAWLGHASNRTRVRNSGLWNQNHVEETYDPDFLDVLEGLIEGSRSRR